MARDPKKRRIKIERLISLEEHQLRLAKQRLAEERVQVKNYQAKIALVETQQRQLNEQPPANAAGLCNLARYAMGMEKQKARLLSDLQQAELKMVAAKEELNQRHAKMQMLENLVERLSREIQLEESRVQDLNADEQYLMNSFLGDVE